MKTKVFNQSTKIFASLGNVKKPKTMMEVSFETGIERANICWEIHNLRESHKAFIVGYRNCSVTGHRAGVYTTSPEYWRNFASASFDLWEDMETNDVLIIRELIQSYFLNGYNSFDLFVPERVSDVWNSVRTFIDGRIGLCRK